MDWTLEESESNSEPFLGLHALPKEWISSRDEYVRDVVEVSLPAIAQDQLATFVDAYVDRNAFTTEEAAMLFERARALGLDVRVHAGQFADVGGAELAARFDAASADHLEQLGREGADAMAKNGVRAVMLPIASFTLGQRPPDVAQLRSAGVSLVVATDANPGTAPTESLPLAMAFAARTYGMTLDEVILGATREAARSLRLLDVGVIEVGARADLALWNVPHEAALLQPWGVSRTEQVWRDGRSIA
jgi:imidazolonepropionase